MNLLLTNDDGVHAEGLAALAAACGALGHQVTVVAPATEQSQCGHRVTTHAPLTVARLADHRYSVTGSPADCVRAALYGIGIRPDAVLAGVNHGGNLGQDIHISGTCAAAREAVYHGLPAAAFSHYLLRDVPLDWTRLSGWLESLLPSVLGRAPDSDCFLNLNFPHHPPGHLPCPEVVETAPARSPLRVAFESQADVLEKHLTHLHYSARYADRPQDPGSDVDVTFGGRISLSRIAI